MLGASVDPTTPGSSKHTVRHRVSPCPTLMYSWCPSLCMPVLTRKIVCARQNLPCHGQRTKTNARTRKGKARTVPNKKK